MKQPVLFLIFNRPETTFKVFAAIRQYKPEKLFIAADGPHSHVETDSIRSAKVRKVVNMVDWDCQVFTRFRRKCIGAHCPEIITPVFYATAEK